MSKIDHEAENVEFDGIDTTELFTISGQNIGVLGAVLINGEKKAKINQMRKIFTALEYLQDAGYQCILAMDILANRQNLREELLVKNTKYLKVSIPRADNRHVVTYVHGDLLTRSLVQPPPEKDDKLTTLKFSMICALRGNWIKECCPFNPHLAVMAFVKFPVFIPCKRSESC